MLVGYARVSTQDQNLDLQKDALTKDGCQKIFTDVASGASNPQGIRFSIIRHCSMILHRDTETGTGACGPEHYRPFP